MQIRSNYIKGPRNKILPRAPNYLEPPPEKMTGRPLRRRDSPLCCGSVSGGESPKNSEDRSSLPSDVGQSSRPSNTVRPQKMRVSPERVLGTSDSGRPECEPETRPFDICRTECQGPPKLNPSLLEINREKRKVLERFKDDPNYVLLSSGMVLLKNYICHRDQVKIIKKCRELGLGSGGFYRPGYRDGSKLNLQMMCLGKNWDPETRLYEDIRPTDGAEPPKIPEEFKKLVEESIRTSHDFLRQKKKRGNIEDELPRMSPDICIVNFYSKTGKLGLHQDRDESKESLDEGLPVVSFSLGDSAEFLYGTERDSDKADKVILESGDVLIFGGKSRHIFHGVSCIYPDTAPKYLIDETKLRPGRLNLTFRQY